MDSSGKIFIDPTKEEIKKKKLIECGEEQIQMNRAERRKWYRENKKRKIT